MCLIFMHLYLNVTLLFYLVNKIADAKNEYMIEAVLMIKSLLCLNKIYIASQLAFIYNIFSDLMRLQI